MVFEPKSHNPQELEAPEAERPASWYRPDDPVESVPNNSQALDRIVLRTYGLTQRTSLDDLPLLQQPNPTPQVEVPNPQVWGNLAHRYSAGDVHRMIQDVVQIEVGKRTQLLRDAEGSSNKYLSVTSTKASCLTPRSGVPASSDNRMPNVANRWNTESGPCAGPCTSKTDTA